MVVDFFVVDFFMGVARFPCDFLFCCDFFLDLEMEDEVRGVFEETFLVGLQY